VANRENFPTRGQENLHAATLDPLRQAMSQRRRKRHRKEMLERTQCAVAISPTASRPTPPAVPWPPTHTLAQTGCALEQELETTCP